MKSVVNYVERHRCNIPRDSKKWLITVVYDFLGDHMVQLVHDQVSEGGLLGAIQAIGSLNTPLYYSMSDQELEQEMKRRNCA